MLSLLAVHWSIPPTESDWRGKAASYSTDSNVDCPLVWTSRMLTMKNCWGQRGILSSTSRLGMSSEHLQLHVKLRHPRNCHLVTISLSLGLTCLKTGQSSSAQRYAARTNWQKFQLYLGTLTMLTFEGWQMLPRLSPVGHPYTNKPSIWTRLRKFSRSGSEVDTQLRKSSYTSFKWKNLKPSPQTFLKRISRKSRTIQASNRLLVRVVRRCSRSSI